MSRVVLAPESLELQTKLQVFFSRANGPLTGRFVAAKGSHRWNRAVMGKDGYLRDGQEVDPSTVRPIDVEPGDAVLFSSFLWHSVEQNLGSERLSMIYRLGPMWCRPMDYETMPEHVLSQVTPRMARMCGHLGDDCNPIDYYVPRATR